MFARTLCTITLTAAFALAAPVYATDSTTTTGPQHGGHGGPGGTPGTPCTTCTPPEPPCTTCTPPTPPVVEPATAVEAADLTFMREEEKLARDLYAEFHEAYDSTLFAAIGMSEQQHTYTMLKLLNRYSLPDPAAGKSIGEFKDADLQALYKSLLAKGLQSETSALQVGAGVEEMAIRDNLDAAAQTTKVDLDAAYAADGCGARNHLRSFAAALQKATGKAYTVQTDFLNQAEVDAILAASMERCGRMR